MRILLVEDSARLQRSLKAGLEDLHYKVDQAYDGREALDLLESESYEVIVLDLMMPIVAGLQVLKELRGRGDLTQILILSAMDQTDDRVRGLDMGADDYLVKPFAFEELVSRLRALGRRSSWSKDPHIDVDELQIDTINQRAFYASKEIELSPSQYGLLLCLARYRGRTFSQEQLIARLYEGDTDVTRNTVEAHVCGLRRKLTAVGAGELLKTRRGYGYLIE